MALFNLAINSKLRGCDLVNPRAKDLAQGWSIFHRAKSAALAQALAGPNELFVALMGWHVGMNAGGTTAALSGVLIIGIQLLFTVITYTAANSAHRNRELRPVLAFKQAWLR